MACKPDSVPPRKRSGGDHPSGHTVAGYLERPTRRLGRAALERLRSRTFRCGLLALLRVGFTKPPRSPGMLVRSYRTVSPLPPVPTNRGRVAVCFLWHYPASHLGLPLAITLLCEVRTFLGPPSPASRGRPANSSACPKYPAPYYQSAGPAPLLLGDMIHSALR